MKNKIKIIIPILAITLATILLSSVSVVIAPPSPVVARIVTSGNPVTEGGITSFYIFVDNNKLITNAWDILSGAKARDLIPGAFVVTQVILTTVDPNGFVYTEVHTPEGTPYSGWVNRWPQTVYNNAGELQLGLPAVLPGEDIVIFMFGLEYGEPTGRYLVKCQIDGAIDGTPVTISAQTQFIIR